MRTFALAVALLLCGLRPASADDSGGFAAAIQLSVGSGSWTDVAIGSWNLVDDNASATPSRIVSLACVNTHSGQDLFILLRASSSEATTAALRLAPGKSVVFDVLLSVETLSFRGGGASTTADCYGVLR
jgi:hypothetical protein